MKKLFVLFAVCGFAFGFSSCGKNDCCDCSGVAGFGSLPEVCKDDYDSSSNGGLSWDDWKREAESVGCNCD